MFIPGNKAHSDSDVASCAHNRRFFMINACYRSARTSIFGEWCSCSARRTSWEAFRGGCQVFERKKGNSNLKIEKMPTNNRIFWSSPSLICDHVIRLSLSLELLLSSTKTKFFNILILFLFIYLMWHFYNNIFSKHFILKIVLFNFLFLLIIFSKCFILIRFVLKLFCFHFWCLHIFWSVWF